MTATAMMRGLVTACFMAVLVLPAAAAGDVRLNPIKETVGHPSFQSKLESGIKLYFRGEPAPRVAQNFGPVTMKLRGNKTEYYPCTRVLVVLLRNLQVKARQAGGDAVVDLVSVFAGRETAEADKFACEYGGTVVAVEIRGQMVRLAGQ